MTWTYANCVPHIACLLAVHHVAVRSATDIRLGLCLECRGDKPNEQLADVLRVPRGLKTPHASVACVMFSEYSHKLRDRRTLLDFAIDCGVSLEAKKLVATNASSRAIYRRTEVVECMPDGRVEWGANHWANIGLCLADPYLKKSAAIVVFERRVRAEVTIWACISSLAPRRE